jgi:hypothetical protein
MIEDILDDLIKSDKPFHGYNKKKHSATGGLNSKYREKLNRETGSNLKAPVTESKPTGKDAARKRSFCARMSGNKGPTSKDGKLTPKGAALKRWKCSKGENMNQLEKLGIKIGTQSLIDDSVNKSTQEYDPSLQVVRKGLGLSPRDVLEQQLSKGGVSMQMPKKVRVSPHADAELDEDDKWEKQCREEEAKADAEFEKEHHDNPSVGSHGEQFHSDADGVDYTISEVDREFGRNSRPFKSKATRDTYIGDDQGEKRYTYKSDLDEIADLVKAKYTKRTGSPGHYKYEYGSSSSETPKKKLLVEYVRMRDSIAYGNLKYPKAEDRDRAYKQAVRAWDSASQEERMEANKQAEKNRKDESKKSETSLFLKAIGACDDLISKAGKACKADPVEEMANNARTIKKEKMSKKQMLTIANLHENSNEVAERKKTQKAENPCWDGYKRKPGTKKFEEGSCVKKSELDDLLEDISKSKYDYNKDGKLDDHEKDHKKIEEKVGLKKKGFIKSQGQGGVVFDFGPLTGNPMADQATALLNRHGDPVQINNAKYQQEGYEKALNNFVTKGEKEFMVEHGQPFGEFNKESKEMLDKGMDEQVLEAFKKGQLDNSASTPAVTNKHNDVQIGVGSEIIKATSETDAALIEMMKAQGMDLSAMQSMDGVADCSTGGAVKVVAGLE